MKGTSKKVQLLLVIGLALFCVSIATPQCVQPPAGLVGWWPGDGNANDIIGSNNGTLRNGATFAAGKVGQAFKFDGVDDWVMIPHSNSLNFGTKDFTVDFWVKFNTTEGEQILIEKHISSLNEPIEFPGWTLTKLEDNVLGGSFGNLDPGPIPTDVWIFVAVTRASNTVTTYWNGVPLGSVRNDANLDSTASLKFGHRCSPADTPGCDDDRGFYLNGFIDEVEIYNRALSSSEIAAIFRAGSVGKCKPFDTTPPTCAVTGSGTNASGQRFTTISCQDGQSGLASVQMTKSSNYTVKIPSFSVGTTGPVVVTVTKIDNSLASQATLGLRDTAGNIGVYDQVDLQAPNGLVSWWPGDGNANDIIGPNSGALRNGAMFAPGVVGQAFKFDGVDDRVQAPTTGLPIGNSDRTLELWVKIDAFVAEEAFFAGYGAFGSYDQTYHLGTHGSWLFFSQWGTGIGGPSLGTGIWYHVAATNVGDTATLYVNGAAVGTATLPINTASGTQFYMGRIPGLLGDTRRLNGVVDEVRIYNRALSASEIQAIFNSGVPANAVEPAAALSVRAFIDGRSDLFIQGSKVWWHHYDFAAPGLEFANEPTILNGERWFPKWPGPGENRDCDCDSSKYQNLAPPLPKDGSPISVRIVAARESVSIIQQPSQANNFTAIVEFDDNAPGGADWYEIGITYKTPVQPSFGQAGQELTVQISAASAHFRNGATNAKFGEGISVGVTPIGDNPIKDARSGDFGTVIVTSPTEALAVIRIDSSATPGPRTVTMFTGTEEHLSFRNVFTVVPAGAPSASSVLTLLSPTTPDRGTPVQGWITVTGTNFPEGNITAEKVNVLLEPGPIARKEKREGLRTDSIPTVFAAATSISASNNGSREVSFRIPDILTFNQPTEYLVSIFGRISSSGLKAIPFASGNRASLWIDPRALSLPPYEFTKLGAPAGFNVRDLNVSSINNWGLMAATAYGDSDKRLRSFLLNRSGSWPTALVVPGALSGVAYHVNNKGEATGTASFQFWLRSRAFIRCGFDNIYRIFYVSGSPTEGRAMSDKGLRVGFYYDAAGHAHGFSSNSWTEYTTIDYPGAAETFVLGVNNANQVVGYYYFDFTRTEAHGFLLEKGVFTTIDHPEGLLGSMLTGINNQGDMVGWYIDAIQGHHGFFYQGDKFTALDFPGSTHTEVNGINDLRQIVGRYVIGVSPSDPSYERGSFITWQP